MFLSCKSYCFFIRNLILSQSFDVEGCAGSCSHISHGVLYLGKLGPPILCPRRAERRRREASRHECLRLGPAGRRPARAYWIKNLKSWIVSLYSTWGQSGKGICKKKMKEKNWMKNLKSWIVSLYWTRWQSGKGVCKKWKKNRKKKSEEKTRSNKKPIGERWMPKN